MTKRSLILVAGGAVVLVGAALRWPPLDAGMVSFTRIEFSSDLVVVDYRMSGPFEIALGHGIRERGKKPEGSGIHIIQSKTLRMEQVAIIPSRYDLIRGGHCVRLRLSRGPRLTVEGNGRQVEVASWSLADAKKVLWLGPGERGKMGDGVGIDIVQFAASPEQEEYLILYAGTNVSRWVE